jgi:hypothetical protein
MLHRNLVAVLVACFVMVGLTRLVQAEDKAADATGTWKWSTQGRNGQAMEFTAKLKQDGDKLTGTVTGYQNTETEIKEGSVKDGNVSFTTSRTFNDQTITTKYTGKIEGDTIKGKSSSTGRNGQPRERDWEAKRGEASTTQPAA